MTSNDGYYDLGSFHRRVSTSSQECQTWFDRGLVWALAFNHEEAAKCFERAIDRDAKCAMAYWGLAFSIGPNYNVPWKLKTPEERIRVVKKSYDALQTAESCFATSSRVETALVKALQLRYPIDQEPTKDNCAAWNTHYADAMETVYLDHQEDADVASLYADAMMNLTPWALWDLQTGEPATGARTLEIKRVLEKSLATNESHIALNHIYIHLMETSQHPEAAVPAANRLRSNPAPDAGHLWHMPSHIDVLIGDYTRAVAANRAAIVADERFLAREGPMNFYTLYRCHDYHFCLYAAMFSGQSKVAFDTITRLEATISEELLRVESPPMADWLESFLAMRIHAYIRFGHWRDIIAIPLPKDRELYCVTTALTYYAKGMAYAALGMVSEAEEQRSAFARAVRLVKPSRTLFNNRCVDILRVAELIFDGELEYRKGNYGAAFARLRESIAMYDALPYDEPWGWMQPARHAYGALLLEQGHVEVALGVYSADLGVDGTLSRAHQHPNNVWSLHGYHECLIRLGRLDEARAVKPKLDAALDVADVPIKSSCFCRTLTAKI